MTPHRIFTTLISLLMLHGSVFCSRLNETQVKQVQKSLVHVINSQTGKQGTGFIFSEQKYIVTAYHVVAGSNGTVKIRYAQTGIERDGTVTKILTSADLALITVSTPLLELPALQRSPTPLQYNADYTAVGFLWDAKSSFPMNVTYAGSRTLSFLPSATLADLTGCGVLSGNAQVLSLTGNSIVPGYSGAPILDGTNGGVIGIGDGGIKEGLSPVSWGISADKLQLLFESTQTLSMIGSSCHSLFSADVIEVPTWQTDTLDLAGKTFYKVRKEKLLTLQNSTDDVGGLNYLMATFPSQIDKANLEFDVYQCFENGAVFILPSGFDYEQDGNRLTMYSGNFRVKFTIDFELVSSFMLNQRTIQMEQARMTFVPGWSWIVDPNFTYATALTRMDGFVVRRGALYQYTMQFNPSTGFTDTYYNNHLFESFAFKNGFLMYLSASNLDFNTPYIWNRQLCVQNGFTGFGCNTCLQETTDWLRMIVAVHFATFSFSSLQ